MISPNAKPPNKGEQPPKRTQKSGSRRLLGLGLLLAGLLSLDSAACRIARSMLENPALETIKPDCTSQSIGGWPWGAGVTWTAPHWSLPTRHHELVTEVRAAHATLGGDWAQWLWGAWVGGTPPLSLPGDSLVTVEAPRPHQPDSGSGQPAPSIQAQRARQSMRLSDIALIVRAQDLMLAARAPSSAFTQSSAHGAVDATLMVSAPALTIIVPGMMLDSSAAKAPEGGSPTMPLTLRLLNVSGQLVPHHRPDGGLDIILNMQADKVRLMGQSLPAMVQPFKHLRLQARLWVAGAHGAPYPSPLAGQQWHALVQCLSFQIPAPPASHQSLARRLVGKTVITIGGELGWSMPDPDNPQKHTGWTGRLGLNLSHWWPWANWLLENDSAGLPESVKVFLRHVLDMAAKDIRGHDMPPLTFSINMDGPLLNSLHLPDPRSFMGLGGEAHSNAATSQAAQWLAPLLQRSTTP
ncbi:hypothetical protein E3E12_01495 [Formicincola oecophyllae]|uniref:Uncharacterized protein n=1 Tax=Formicincola oecophyllae TaxID=2558361 RepID=A0A4Y6U9Q6_9PROT|nr:hypothetical protein [Formicincola oecophyllae]QDH13091.1 hypothetical protein E3E12_01495 [Formicincola oecophyllae]